MKRIFISIILIIVFPFILHSERFKFNPSESTKRRIVCTINGRQYSNGKFLLEYSQNIKTIAEVLSHKDGKYLIKEDTSYSNLNKFSSSKIQDITKTYVSIFYRDEFGNMDINSQFLLPTLRNIPTFPDKDVAVGEKWRANGIEVQDIFGDGILSTFPVDVEYEFIGYDEKQFNKKVSVIKYKYEINRDNDGVIEMHPSILNLNAKMMGTIYFDHSAGSRVKEEYQRDYIFTILNPHNKREAIEFIDDGIRVWNDIKEMNKDKIIKDLKNTLKERDIVDIEVEKDEKGVKLSIDNVQFNPDSSKLLPKERERLDKISDILKKFKDNPILIEGHTTDRGTKSERDALSLERARSVAEYLIEKDSIDHENTSCIGRGGEVPLDSNETMKGRMKNRRVEIYILEE